MDYFQAPSSSTSGGGADGQDGDMTAARAEVQSSDVNPFNFNMPSSSSSSSFKLPSTSASSRKSNSATTITGDSSAEKAVHSSTTMTTSSNANNSNNGSTIGFREALMKRQGSSPSSFFSAATPRTPAASAHPLRPSASSMGVVSTAEITTTGSSSNTARWQKEYSSGIDSNADAPSTSPANPASSNSSPKRSMSSWLSKSPRSPPAISTSTDVNSKTLPSSSSRPPTSSSNNSFFGSNPNSTSASSSSTSSSPAVHSLQRSTTTFTNSDRYSESPLDIPSKSTPSNTASTTSNATSTTTAPAPPAAPAAARPSAGKTISSSSSSSTSSGKTVTDSNNASSSQGGQAGHSMTSQSSTSSSSTSTTTTTISTSPKEAPPTTTTSSSGATDLKQRSCPIPSLRMPFTGGGGSGSKLPSGACASLPMPSMKLGTTGARTGITRAFGGAVGAISRKGPEVVQNPRFKAVPVGEELKNLLSSSFTSSTSSVSAGSASNARGDTTLIVDLRPHTAFVGQGRLKGSINICVPSTLLRRPAFALNKIAETICSRKDQAHFNRILLDDNTSTSSSNDEEESQKSTTNVIILDQETVLLSQESTVHSLMSKIEKAGYNGDIYWIRGGWNAISTHVESDNNVLAEYVDMELLNEDEEEEEEEMVEEEEIMQDEYTRDGEVEEESEGASSEMSDVQDTRTPRQPFPGMTSSAAAVGNENDAAGGGNGGNGGAGGAYFQNYLQGPRGINTKGRSSQSSFTSTASSDSLFPSSIASSQSSMGSGGGGGDSHHLHASSSYSKDRASSTSPVAPTFDSSKLHLPHLRPSTSPSHSTSSASSSSTSSAPRGATVPTLTGPSKGKAAFLSSSGGALSLSSNTGKTRSTSAGGTAIIRPKNLPMAAFQYNSTAQGAHGDVPQKNNSNNIGKGQFQMGLDNDHHGGAAGAGSTGMEKQKSGSNPFGRKTAANPFFDNIRQNIESQSLDHVLEHVAPLEIPAELTKPTLVEHLPSFLKDLIKMTPKTRASKLHKEYFDIEQAEQRRLQKVLNWHCQQSVVVDYRVEAAKAAAKAKEAQEKGNGDAQMQTDDKEENPTYHPFSISAGVEKGHLNRYKNMWPYEHARVRLESVMSPTCGDYINASHIQLRGTSKRYIASQGPLEQTTEHFWRLVLQENVHVIVMLTLLQEGGREKCSNYFQSGTYGDIQINLVEEKGSEEAMKKSVCKDFGFFSIDEEVPKVDSPADAEPGNVAKSDRASQAPFYASTPLQANDSVKMKKYSVQTPSGNSQMQGHKRSLSRRLDSAIVRRTIEIRRRSDPPDTPPKVVRHIQYIKWPDFDIPPDPNVVIDLISETNKAQRLDDITGEESPVLVHCSAGVGRTGTFIAVDTLLERYRRERREARTSGSPSNGPPRARMRRSGSDLGSSLHDLSLTDADKSSVQSPTTGGNSGQKVVEDTPRVRPPALRSSSSQETPRHLQARLGIKELLPEDHSDPILSLVDQMREQRMSSVANAGQYIFTYLALLAGISQELAEEGVTAASPVA